MLLRLFQSLPMRLQLTLYFRLLSKRKCWFGPLFAGARLKYGPGMRMRLSTQDVFHGQIAFTGVYEEKLSSWVRELSRSPGGLMIDVGANYGYFSLLWCAGRNENRVIAVEAAPANMAPLNHNIVQNNLLDRVAEHAWAASNQDGMSSFDPGSCEETGWGGLAAGEAQHVISVPARRLDKEFAGAEVEILKIDCEGADAWVLEGAAGLLAAGRIKNIIFEENVIRQQALGIPEGHAVSLLKEHGYSCQLLEHDPWIKTYHAKRDSFTE